MIDLNLVDSPNHSFEPYFDNETMNNTRNQIFNQIENLENFGIDLIKDIEDISIKVEVLKEVIVFVNETYLDVSDIDHILISDKIILEIGYYIYLFLVIDCYNSIFPNFIKISNMSEFRQIQNRLSIDYSAIKQKLLKSVHLIIEPLLKLKNIDPSVSKDIKYKAFLKRLAYELDLIEYGEIDNFVERFMAPVFRKYFNELLWRAL